MAVDSGVVEERGDDYAGPLLNRTRGCWRLATATRSRRRLQEEALALWQPNGELLGTSDELMELSQVAYTLGDYDEGRRLLQESLAIPQAAGTTILVIIQAFCDR